MSTEPHRLQLDGPTMGTRWSVLADVTGPLDAEALQTVLQTAVAEVDAQMSTWRPDSALMRFNAAPCGEWVALPALLMTVLATGLGVSRLTRGAFELNVGAAVTAWGFGAGGIDGDAIRAASTAPRISAAEAMDLDPDTGRARKSDPLALDLSGIAKGYGVDRLAGVLADHGITQALCAIDGEVRALGTQGNGQPWSVAIETPDSASREALSALSLADGSVATSGDYRHFVTVKGQRLSHTIDPRRGSPRVGGPASVSVLSQSCMLADAMATALMVMGEETGTAFARAQNISALFLLRENGTFRATGTGVFAA